MKTRTWILCVALTFAAPVAADPPGGHPGRGQGAKASHPGNGNGNGKPDKAHGQQQGDARGNAQADRDRSTPTPDPVDRNRPPSTNPVDRNRPPQDGVVRGPGRGNSQGPAHANPRAIAAVCRNPNAAAHSVLGSRCDVVAYRDPTTGGTVYTQPGMEPPPVVERTPDRDGRRIDEPKEREVRPR